MESISLILDRILLFASRTTYSLAAGLELLCVLPRVDLPETHRHVLHRLVNPHDHGHSGHLDVLQLLDTSLLPDTFIAQAAEGAAAANHTHVLDWLFALRPDPEAFWSTAVCDGLDEWTSPLMNVVRLAAEHAHMDVLEWCVAHGAHIETISNEYTEGPFTTATRHCQICVLDWLKAYAVERGLDYDFPAVNCQDSCQKVTARAQLAMLDWWKADYATRSDVSLFPTNAEFGPEYAWCTDHGLLVVDWWRASCTEMGREFVWPVLNSNSLWYLVRNDSLSLCQWWWDETVHRIGIQQAKRILRDILDPICEFGRVGFLDWYWDLCLDSGGEIEFPQTWQPRHPFFRLNVIEWWDTKIERGQLDAGVLFNLCDLDALFQIPVHGKIEVTALDWWWARRDRFRLEPQLSPGVLSRLPNYREHELFLWYLDRCTSDSPLPPMTLDALATMVSMGRVDMVERIWQLSVSRHHARFVINQGKGEIRTLPFRQRVSSWAVLDYLWDLCARIGVRFEPGYNPKNAIKAVEADELGAARWWYAMHCVHGTVFPNIKELDRVAPGGVTSRWIQSLSDSQHI
ncbi:hypothetical protein BC828DRAFT_394162 [Blastocladiella britannica]|nr:hypothetical protein BC828DRAFT_394162 [Blastocladiella britannica]